MSLFDEHSTRRAWARYWQQIRQLVNDAPAAAERQRKKQLIYPWIEGLCITALVSMWLWVLCDIQMRLP